jgi:hypothetical protein
MSLKKQAATGAVADVLERTRKSLQNKLPTDLLHEVDKLFGGEFVPTADDIKQIVREYVDEAVTHAD